MFLALYIAHTQLFCLIDDFLLKFEAIYWKFLKQSRHFVRIRPTQLSLSEINFIAIWYKCSHFNNFKAFFAAVKHNYSHLFKCLPCYQCMIYLINTHQLALHALHYGLMKEHTSNYLWIDSTILAVCRNQRIQRYKSIISIATRGKSSMGWFFGCKLHLIMDQTGNIVSTALSNGQQWISKWLSI